MIRPRLLAAAQKAPGGRLLRAGVVVAVLGWVVLLAFVLADRSKPSRDPLPEPPPTPEAVALVPAPPSPPDDGWQPRITPLRKDSPPFNDDGWQPRNASEGAPSRSTPLLSAARDAASRGAVGDALDRYEEYLRRTPQDRVVRTEYERLRASEQETFRPVAKPSPVRPAHFVEGPPSVNEPLLPVPTVPSLPVGVPQVVVPPRLPEEVLQAPKPEAAPPSEVLPKPRVQPAPPADPKALLLLSAARNAVARGAEEEAISRFEEYLRLVPDDPETRKEYAGILAQSGRLRPAVQQYRDLLAQDAANPDLLVSLSDVYVRLKEYRRAATELVAALRVTPTNLATATKLARVYVFDGDIVRASQVFDQYLSRVMPGDPKAPKTFGALLVELGKPEQAIAFLQPFRDKTPDDAETLAYVVRAYTKLGDRAKALETIAALNSKKAGALVTILELGDALFQSAELDLAQQVYSLMLRVEPTNFLAQLGMARVQVAQFLPSSAAPLLRSLKAATPIQTRLLKLAAGEYHQLIGEYTQAKHLYRELLAKDGTDTEARLALAEVYKYTRDDEKAKAEYAVASAADSSQGRKGRLGLAEVLFNQRKFAEALEAARAVSAEFPFDGVSRAMMVRILGKSGRVAEAEASAAEYLAVETRDEAGALEVRIALGKALLDSGRPADAAQQYEMVLARPAGRLANAYYGQVAAYSRMGLKGDAARVLEAALAQLGGELRARLLLSDEHVANFDDEGARDLLMGATRFDGENLAVMIRLADVEQRLSSFTWNTKIPIAMAESILAISPTNVRGHLTLGRSYGVAQRFLESADAHRRLTVLDPEAVVPKMERARALYSANQFSAAQAAYAEVGLPMPVATPVPSTPSGVLGSVDATTATSSTAPDGSTGTVPLGMYNLSNARAAEVQAARLEAKAKDLRGWRDYAATPIYQELLGVRPDNTEAMFDLAQIYSSQQHTQKALAAYSDLLVASPRHREAAIAVDRAGMELAPQVHFRGDAFWQEGRDRLASVWRLKGTTAFRYPCRDENEYAQVHYARLRYEPTVGQDVDGNLLGVRGQWKPVERLLAHAQVDLESYGGTGFQDRAVYDAGVRWTPVDWLNLYPSVYRENVVENGGSIGQDIHRSGFRVGGDTRPGRRWNIGGSYQFADYSDANQAHYGHVFSEVVVCWLPQQLKIVSQADYISFERQTTNFDVNNEASLLTATHPYFSPGGFTYYETRIEWLHYLSRDYFAHANVFYYGLQYGLGFDDGLQHYHQLRGLIHYDHCSWLSCGLDAKTTLSSVYNSFTAGAYLVIRLPYLRS